jgi:L-arabinose isomerase
MAEYAAITGTEFILIDQKCDIELLRKELRWNDLYYRMKNA